MSGQSFMQIFQQQIKDKKLFDLSKYMKFCHMRLPRRSSEQVLQCIELTCYRLWEVLASLGSEARGVYAVTYGERAKGTCTISVFIIWYD
jgi:hypothetical protein